ncbi:PrsW family intramembrane metalloprotease [Streptomyces sp. NPDC051940]|uniref:PrsW family intramembrane metalloprotease n=1 Tax=Streptomyces sp. NPDC051940 TaxID=3155675 RepID=UPI0034351C7C
MTPSSEAGTFGEAGTVGEAGTAPQGLLASAPPDWDYQPPRVRIWQRRALRLTLVVTVLAVCALIMLWTVRRETGTHGFLVGLGLATLPSPLLILAFRWIDKVDPAPWRNMAFAFAWGAFAATLVAIVANSFAAEWIASGLPVGRTREADLWTASLVAPVVEETAKAGAVLLLFFFRRRHFTGLVDGIVIAGIAATGFAFTENILYLGRAYGEDQNLGYDTPFSITAATFIVRGIFSPFAHPLFTAMTGIGFGLAAMTARDRKARRTLLPIAGVLTAMLMHGMWNGSLVFGGLGFLAVYALFMVPVFGLLIWLAIWSRGRELRTLKDKLPAYATAGWLTLPEPHALSKFRTRKLARDLAARTHGKPGKKAVREYERAATSLALLRAHAERGNLAPDFTTAEAALLNTLWEHRVIAQPALTQAAWSDLRPRLPMQWHPGMPPHPGMYPPAAAPYGPPPGAYGPPTGTYPAPPGAYGNPGLYPAPPGTYPPPGAYPPPPGTAHPPANTVPAPAARPYPHPAAAQHFPPPAGSPARTEPTTPGWGMGGGRHT